MINYSITPRKNPVNKVTMYHAQAQTVAPVDLVSLARDISSQCTVTIHDVKAVISALEEHITRKLQNGNSVRLGDLGSFHVTLVGKGAPTAAEHTTDLIKAVRVRFVCSSRMRNAFRVDNGVIGFRRIGVVELPAEEDKNPDDTKPEEGGGGEVSPEQ